VSVADLDPVMSVEEAAEYLRISRAKLYQLCAAGQIRHFKIGTRRLFRAQALREFIEAAEQGANPSPPEPKKASH
jgi:excisionase family DNA binding protein